MKHEKAISKLKSYLTAWKKGDFKEMFQHSNKTYRAQHIDHSEAHIIEFLGSKKLTSFKIGDLIKMGPAMVEVPVEIYYQQKKEKFHKLIKVRIICEIEAYLPSVNGSWGVNPISAFKENEIKPTKEVKNER